MGGGEGEVSGVGREGGEEGSLVKSVLHGRRRRDVSLYGREPTRGGGLRRCGRNVGGGGGGAGGGS